MLFYILGLALAVVPLMLAEFAWAGVLGVASGALILSFYSVIGGWTLAYAVKTALEGPLVF